jgi:hypothetical protein
LFVPQAVGRTEGLDETGLDLDQVFEDPRALSSFVRTGGPSVVGHGL